YAALRLLCLRDRSQPRHNDLSFAYINQGCFQLPVAGGRLPPLHGAFDDQMLKQPRIPCASLLVRVAKAPINHLSAVMSCTSTPPADWFRLGLRIPTPTYASGAYDGSRCAPLDSDQACYQLRAKGPQGNVGAGNRNVGNIGLGGENMGMGVGTVGNAESDAQRWVQMLLPPPQQIRRPLDYSFSFPHDAQAGVLVGVQRLYNMPEIGGLQLFSSSAAVYKAMGSHTRSPVFEDGFVEFTPPSMSPGLFLVLDVRRVKVEGARGLEADITVEGAENGYWTLLPLSLEKIPGQGFAYVQSGVFHLPLIEGPVPDVWKSQNPLGELSEAMVVVRVLNPLVRELVEPSLGGGVGVGVGPPSYPPPLAGAEAVGVGAVGVGAVGAGAVGAGPVQTALRDALVRAAASGVSRTAKISQYVLDESRFPLGGGETSRTLQAALPSGEEEIDR
ncbi:hypothetical protein B484DRAFT_407003, partial [Ochromonadaceae sp. CCMP2298]